MHIGASPIAAAFSVLMDLSQGWSTPERFCANCKMGDRQKGEPTHNSAQSVSRGMTARRKA
jgi:hypothetical protein